MNEHVPPHRFDRRSSDRAPSILESAVDLAEQGGAIVWLLERSKRPVFEGWTKLRRATPLELRQTYRDGFNGGLRLGAPSEVRPRRWLHAIDLDIRDPEARDEAWAALVRFHPDAESWPQSISGSGGESRHLLFVSDRPFRKTNIARSKDTVMRPLQERETRVRKAYARDYAEFKAEDDKDAEPPPIPPRYLVADTTTEALGEILARQDRGALVHRDEFVGWIGAMEKYGGRGGASDRAFWLQAFDGGPYSYDRIGRGGPTGITIHNLSVSLLGGIQPARLAELQGLTSDGLLQRFLPVMLAGSEFRRDVSDRGAGADYAQLVERCIDARATKLRLSDGGLDAMETLHRHLHDLEQGSGGLAVGFQAFVGKLAGIAGSLTLILHMIDDDPREQEFALVKAETVERVDRLIREFILPHALEFYRSNEAATNGDRLQRIASWIITSDKPRIRASDLTHNVRFLRGLSLFDINAQLSPLVAGGWLTPVDYGPTNNAWTVSYRLKARFAERAAEEEKRKQAIAELMNSDRRGRRTKQTPVN